MLFKKQNKKYYKNFSSSLYEYKNMMQIKIWNECEQTYNECKQKFKTLRNNKIKNREIPNSKFYQLEIPSSKFPIRNFPIWKFSKFEIFY